MARIRTIKPDFFRHEKLFEAEQDIRLPLRVAYAGLWTAADREGRFVWSPRALKLDCLPYDDVDFSRVLDALATRGFIVKYAVDDKEYGFIPSWHEHQVINTRERASTLPEPNENNKVTRAPRVIDACTTRHVPALGEGKGREGEGRGKEGKIDDDAAGAQAANAKLPSDAEDRLMVIAMLPRLISEFMAAMPERAGGHPKKATEAAFRAAIRDGQDPHAIIDRAHEYRAEAIRLGTAGGAGVIAADTWLISRPWSSKAPARKQTAGYALAKQVAGIAGRADEFEMTGWGGAAQRAQVWLDANGWTEEGILGSVREQASRKPTPPNSIAYFEKGIAEHIARMSAPIPTATVTTTGKPNAQQNSKSIVAAADRLVDRVRAMRSSGVGSGARPVDARLLPEG